MTDNHANSEADRSGRATAPSLRDRIADVLADEFKRQGYACEWAVLADAVIRELGNLRQEPHRFQCGSDGCSRYRIISDWTTDE